VRRGFDHLAQIVTDSTGSPVATSLALLSVVIWALTGPLFGFSETWQLVINTATTILTFLMVFVIQAAQNRNTAALHLKLDSLIAATEKADNRLAGIELRSSEEAEKMRAHLLEGVQEAHDGA
jgi:low affinity Fe/Cu permease